MLEKRINMFLQKSCCGEFEKIKYKRNYKKGKNASVDIYILLSLQMSV